jgi:hypothetical protein
MFSLYQHTGSDRRDSVTQKEEHGIFCRLRFLIMLSSLCFSGLWACTTPDLSFGAQTEDQSGFINENEKPQVPQLEVSAETEGTQGPKSAANVRRDRDGLGNGCDVDSNDDGDLNNLDCNYLIARLKSTQLDPNCDGAAGVDDLGRCLSNAHLVEEKKPEPRLSCACPKGDCLDGDVLTVCSSGADYTSGSAALRALQPGGKLLFCAGETFEVGEMYRLGDLNGAYVGAYGAGDMPILRGPILFLNSPAKGLTFDGLHFRGHGTGHGFRMDAGTNHITVMNSIIENYSVGVFVKKSYGSNLQHNIRLINNLIQNNTSQGLLGGGPDLYVGHNTFINNGHSGMRDHNIYTGCNGMPEGEPCPQLIEYNRLQGASKDDQGRCQGAEIVAHGYLNGLVIRNNVISEPDGRVGGCYGIMISPAYRSTNFFSNVTITGNELYDSGRVAIYAEAINGLTITNNSIVNSNANHDMLGIVVLSGKEVSKGGYATSNVLIEDNQISLTSNSGGRMVPIDVSGDVLEPITVRNNNTAADATALKLSPDNNTDAGQSDTSICDEKNGLRNTT